MDQFPYSQDPISQLDIAEEEAPEHTRKGTCTAYAHSRTACRQCMLRLTHSMRPTIVCLGRAHTHHTCVHVNVNIYAHVYYVYLHDVYLYICMCVCMPQQCMTLELRSDNMRVHSPLDHADSRPTASAAPSAMQSSCVSCQASDVTRDPVMDDRLEQVRQEACREMPWEINVMRCSSPGDTLVIVCRHKLPALQWWEGPMHISS